MTKRIGLPTKAITRKSNVASQKVAMSAGFTLESETDEWLTFLFNPLGCVGEGASFSLRESREPTSGEGEARTAL